MHFEGLVSKRGTLKTIMFISLWKDLFEDLQLLIEVTLFRRSIWLMLFAVWTRAYTNWFGFPRLLFSLGCLPEAFVSVSRKWDKSCSNQETDTVTWSWLWYYVFSVAGASLFRFIGLGSLRNSPLAYLYVLRFIFGTLGAHFPFCRMRVKGPICMWNWILRRYHSWNSFLLDECWTKYLESCAKLICFLR